MSGKFNFLLTSVFCAFLSGMLVISLLLPDKDFSPLENRYLQQVPELSLESVTSGEFMADAEKYTADHVVGRDFWVALNTWCERLSGKRENNGVYFGKDGTLINRVDTPTDESLDKKADYVDKLVDNVNANVYFGLIPSAASVWADRLPAGAPTADEDAIIDRLYSATQALPVDLRDALHANRAQELYYRTDHHWTSLGAYYGYTAIADAMGLTPVPLTDYEKTTVSDSFNGTIFSSSGVRWLEPDRIDTYVPEDGITVTSYFNGKPEPGALYVDRFLAEKDKYSYFLGGVCPLHVIETENTEAPRLLIVRDSYSDSLVPFLTPHFSQIHMYDLRYNNTSLAQYVEDNDIDSVLVLYSIPNFIDEMNLTKLGR